MTWRSSAVRGSNHPPEVLFRMSSGVACIRPDGSLCSVQVPSRNLVVRGTNSLADCGDRLAQQLCYGHFGVPGGVISPNVRLSGVCGVSVMVLQLQKPDKGYLLAVKPAKSLAPFPENIVANRMLTNPKLRVFGSALFVRNPEQYSQLFAHIPDRGRGFGTRDAWDRCLVDRGPTACCREEGGKRTIQGVQCTAISCFSCISCSCISKSIFQHSLFWASARESQLASNVASNVASTAKTPGATRRRSVSAFHLSKTG